MKSYTDSLQQYLMTSVMTVAEYYSVAGKIQLVFTSWWWWWGARSEIQGDYKKFWSKLIKSGVADAPPLHPHG